MTLTNRGPIKLSSNNNGSVRTYTVVYLIESTSKTHTAYEVENLAGMQVIGDVHPDDSLAVVNNKSANLTKMFSAWELTIVYSTERQFDPTDPNNDEVLVSFDGEIYQEPFFEDVNNVAATNSAGDYYLDPPPTRDNAHLIAHIVSSHTSIPSWVLDFQNAVNSGPITIGGLSIPAGYAKMWPIRVSNRQKRGNTDYYSLTQEIHIHKDGWKFKPLDAGYHELTTEQPPKKVPIELDGGGTPSMPVPLDGQGRQLASKDPADAIFREHQRYPELDFTNLPGIT